MKIHNLAIENTKRVKAVALTPAENGLTVIGGGNGQGKTSILDAIAWALGGDRYRPSNAAREGSVLPPYIKITMSDGLIVERKGKNSALTVTDPSGRKAGQQLLNEFVSELALNLPKFMQASDKEKADTLLKIIGVGDQLKILQKQEDDAYQRRRTIGQIANQKEAFVKSMPYYTDAPAEMISALDLIRRQQEILAKNGENQRLRQNRDKLLAERHLAAQQLQAISDRYDQLCKECEIAERSAQDLEDESTEEIERELEQIEDINRKVRANLDHDKAEEDGKQYVQQYNQLTAQIDDIRKKKRALLDNAPLPLPGLSVEDGALVYNGKRWDCLSSSEQMRVGTAIVRQLNPKCEFILLDKLEQMDRKTLEEFGAWLEEEGLQAIATRVSTGEECTLIIEDGMPAEPKPSWKNAGSFNGFARKE